MGSCFRPKRTAPDGTRVPYRRYRLVWTDENGRRKSRMAFRDKAASVSLLRKLETEVERRKAGLAPRGDDQGGGRSLWDTAEAYIGDLERRGCSEEHTRAQRGFLHRLASWNKWKRLGELTSAALTKALAALASGGYATKSLEHYRKAARCFARWCVEQGHLSEDPLRGVRPAKGKDRPRRRRAPTVAEWQALLAASPRHRRDVYAVASLTGLRKKEMRLIECRDFDLARDPPRMTVRAEVSKSDRDDTVPLLPDVVPLLRELVAGKHPTAKVFPVLPSKETIKRDLAKAGIKDDGTGRRVEFHSLRYFFCTLLARKLPIQTVRLMMRHRDITTTCRIYMDLGLSDLEEAVLRLPSLVALPPAHDEAK